MALASVLFGLPANAQCTYDVELIVPDCTYGGGSGEGISTDGSITGSYSCGFGPEKAFGWFGAPPIVTVPILAGYTDMSGRSVNPFMEIAGDIENIPSVGVHIHHAFLFSGGKTIVLSLLPGANLAEADGIHQALPSTVVGYTNNTVGGPLAAAVWDSRNTVTALTLPLGPNSVASDINDKGQIVGWMGQSPATSHGFIWSKGGVIDLGIPPGAIASTATGINSSGHVCGRSAVSEPGDGPTVRGWVWSNGTYTMIDPLPGYRTCRPKDINDDGTIVGACEDAIEPANPNNPAPAFIWKNGVMTSLGELVTLDPWVILTHAQGINNAGQIVGGVADLKAVSGYAVRLTPIPSSIGDFNCDGIVNVDDLLGVINHWNFTTPNLDFDGSGTVGVGDLLIVLDNWTL